MIAEFWIGVVLLAAWCVLLWMQATSRCSTGNSAP